MSESMLTAQILQFARLTADLTEESLDLDGAWEDYDEGLHTVFIRSYAQLREPASRPPAQGEWPVVRAIRHMLKIESNFVPVAMKGISRFRQGSQGPSALRDDEHEAFWQGLLGWLQENPGHPERRTVWGHLREIQDWYLRFSRESLGWAISVLEPGHAA